MCQAVSTAFQMFQGDRSNKTVVTDRQTTSKL